MDILGWILVIFFIAFVIVMIIFNIAQVIYFIKCFKVRECSNKTCHFREFCGKYRTIRTEEDIKRIRMLIEELE